MREMKRGMTPRKAMETECRFCKNGQRFDCESNACELNNLALSSLRRIRAHCLTCIGSSPQVAGCRGDILYPSPHKCSLWEYRLGTNPKRRGIGGKAGNPGIEKIRGKADSRLF